MDLSRHKLVFAEEFDELSITSSEANGWNTTYYWGDRYLGNEQQIYVDPSYGGYGLNPFTVADGVLTITAQKASEGFEAPSTFKHAPDQTYVSGLLNSEAMFSIQYGYFEIRAEMPSGRGLWPAFWLLQSNGDWPAEYDIVEVLGHDTKTLHATSHWTDASGVHRMEHGSANTFDASDGFHTYGFDWTKDKITWYYDGVKVFEADNRVTDHSMYMLINLAVGGSWPGKPNDTTPFPAEMKVDYVRVYQAPVGHDVVGMPAHWADIELSAFSTLNESAVKTIDWKTARASWDYSVTLEPHFTAIKMMNDWAHYVRGNDRDNYIEGSAGKHNQIDGGKGNDVYKGGAGLDIFVVRNGEGNDRILDFSNTPGNTDKLKMDGFHFTHFDELAPFLRQLPEGVMLRLDEDQAVFFDGIQIADLKPEQFVFVNSVPAPAGATPVRNEGPNDPSDPGTAEPAPLEPSIRYVEASTPADALRLGSSGIDTLTYTGTKAIQLASDIENIISTGRSVTVDGNALDNQITATGTGYHRLSGGKGNDTIKGGDFGNTLNGGKGNDRLEGGKGQDFFTGGAGDDIFVFAKGDITRSGARDHIGDFEGAGQPGGDLLVFEAFENGTLRFASYHQLYDSRGINVGHDETKQYYNVYDNDVYEGTILVENIARNLLTTDDYTFI